MKLIGGILLGILALALLLNAMRMLFFNLSRFSQAKKMAIPGYVGRFVVVQIFNFGLVALLIWGSVVLLRGGIFREITSEKPTPEQIETTTNVRTDLSRYITKLSKAIEDSGYLERIDKIYDSPVISDSEVVDVYNDFLDEMKKIFPKTPEVLEVHRAYIQTLEDYVAAILKEGHVSAMFRYTAEHQEVIDRLKALCEKYGLKVKVQ